MTTQEVIEQIEAVQRELKTPQIGLIRSEELTVCLIELYKTYIYQSEERIRSKRCPNCECTPLRCICEQVDRFFADIKTLKMGLNVVKSQVQGLERKRKGA